MPLNEKIAVLKEAISAIEDMDIHIGNGHVLHHGNKSHWTSIAKAVTWRVIASVITALLVYIVTGHLQLAATVGALDVVVKLIAYYIHERVWLRLGRRL
jgi:uncharacterized membrane protein